MSTLQCATDENGVPHFWCNTQEGFGTRGLHKCIWILENKHCAGGVCCGECKQRFSSNVAKQRQFSFLPPSAVNLWMFIISICFLKTSSWAIIVTKSNHCCETTLTISALCAKGADKNHGIAAVFWPNYLMINGYIQPVKRGLSSACIYLGLLLTLPVNAYRINSSN